MDSSVSLRSFHCSVPTVSSPHALAERTCAFSPQSRSFSGKLVYSQAKRNLSILSCAKTPDSSTASKSSGQYFVFLSQALLVEVCDETEVAEVKVKVGDFEMHLRRNIGGATTAPLSNISPAMAPPIPSEPMNVTAPAAPPSSPSPKKSDPFINVSFGKSPKLAALEASGATRYVLVASPTVGAYKKTRTVKKGKPQPRFCKEVSYLLQGDMIKEGQVIAYLDQVGTELPVRSDVAGEVLKIFFDEGEYLLLHMIQMLLDTRIPLWLCCHHFQASRFSNIHPASYATDVLRMHSFKF
ncbi:Biotin carboxyl carrier protein of acetyl-CoA carboxylase [Linum perenne]